MSIHSYSTKITRFLVHQGFVLSSFIFVAVVEAQTSEFRDDLLWEVLYANNLRASTGWRRHWNEKSVWWKKGWGWILAKQRWFFWGGTVEILLSKPESGLALFVGRRLKITQTVVDVATNTAQVWRSHLIWQGMWEQRMEVMMMYTKTWSYEMRWTWIRMECLEIVRIFCFPGDHLDTEFALPLLLSIRCACRKFIISEHLYLSVS